MVYNYWEKVVKKVVPEPGGGGVPEPRSIRVTPVLGEGGVPEPRKEDPLKRLGGEAESIKRRGLLASLVGRSWSLKGVQDAAKLLGGLLDLNRSVSALLEGEG